VEQPIAEQPVVTASAAPIAEPAIDVAPAEVSLPQPAVEPMIEPVAEPVIAPAAEPVAAVVPPAPVAEPVVDVAANLEQAGLVMIETAANRAQAAAPIELPKPQLGRKPRAAVVVADEPLQMVETRRE
jgi:ribonuclease E